MGPNRTERIEIGVSVDAERGDAPASRRTIATRISAPTARGSDGSYSLQPVAAVRDSFRVLRSLPLGRRRALLSVMAYRPVTRTELVIPLEDLALLSELEVTLHVDHYLRDSDPLSAKSGDHGSGEDGFGWLVVGTQRARVELKDERSTASIESALSAAGPSRLLAKRVAETPYLNFDLYARELGNSLWFLPEESFALQSLQVGLRCTPVPDVL